MPETTTPTASAMVEIEIGGRARNLFMGFRAYKMLGLDPFKQETIKEYLSDLTMDKVCAYLHAGLANAAIVTKDPEPAPTADELIDMLDIGQFALITNRLKEAVAATAPKAAAAAESGIENP